VTSSVPGDDGGNPGRVVIDGKTTPGDELPVQIVSATAGLFATFDLRLLEGRAFSAAESIDPAARVTVINERLAQRLWPGASALGRRVGIAGPTEIEWFRVVGVSPNVYYEEVGEATEQSRLNMFVPFALSAPRTAAILLRVNGDPQSFGAAARSALHRVRAGLPVYDVRTMREVRRFTTWDQQFFGVMMGGFAATALLLACLGLYALLAYAARRRTHEIGVRLALGADTRAVAALFFGQALRIGAAGLAAGLLLSIAMARALRGILFAVDAFDPALFAGTAAALLLTVAVASYAPARRAGRTNPMAALRAD
jgi:hypothetical protein